jgi:hypothetical protein
MKKAILFAFVTVVSFQASAWPYMGDCPVSLRSDTCYVVKMPNGTYTVSAPICLQGARCEPVRQDDLSLFAATQIAANSFHNGSCVEIYPTIIDLNICH